MKPWTEIRNQYLNKTVQFITEKGWDCKNEIYLENTGSFFFFTLQFEKIKIKIYCDELYGTINLRYRSNNSGWYEIDELKEVLNVPFGLENLDQLEDFEQSYITMLNYMNNTLDFMKEPNNWIVT